MTEQDNIKKKKKNVEVSILQRGKGTKLWRFVCLFCFCFLFFVFFFLGGVGVGYKGNTFIKRKNTAQRMKTINRFSKIIMKEPKKKTIDKTIIHGLENIHTFLKEYMQALHRFLGDPPRMKSV